MLGKEVATIDKGTKVIKVAAASYMQDNLEGDVN